MGSNWPEVTVNEICSLSMGPFGSDVKKDCFVAFGVPIINGSNISGFRLNDNGLRFVTEQKADSLSRSIAKRGDIVVTHRGTLGQVALIPSNSQYDRYLISQSQFLLRCNDRVLPEYLVYYLHSPEGQGKILANKVQVGVPALARPTSTFRDIRVPLPPIYIQKKISTVLSSIDSEISNLVQINGHLSQNFVLAA
ncbi:Restriction endonuclease S subunit [Bifidobacterium goeldii]|uniref:Restriction endonuclease S subunit n=1 Tax=Bifidobacterium goeldii TaxID=2306975 RepID=A0A430FM70_9BIFI|nr:restriction endonuclease subunit S [Bifidobacterium goeldii]RSX54023.1 Restriction endonuclease S subunit [Bifidobacterium goeldii]